MAAVSSSCSKEDNYRRRIIGKWEIVHCASGNFDPTNIDPSQYNDDYISGGLTWEFSNDGIIKWTNSYGTSTHPYTITEEYLSIGGAAYHIQELTSSTLIVWFGSNGHYLYYEFQRVG